MVMGPSWCVWSWGHILIATWVIYMVHCFSLFDVTKWGPFTLSKIIFCFLLFGKENFRLKVVGDFEF